MFKRHLRPQTIIAPELYVRRAADRQLQQILSDMGRPGYVLVARQMGKTNLLLNAKRESQTDEDLFAYVDVSNVFPDIRGFFRNLIDILVDTAGEVLGQLVPEIAKRREAAALSPHKEHEQELRTILRTIPGKIVVCLDEIDALTRTDYSDQIFSLIRSIYFSGRANFPEFHRLTYVLSGVAEPTEIIKNKEISPFNIGEKIYLDDFSPDEFAEFLERAKLSVPREVGERVYFWTAGNPRMTWDLCAALEERVLAGDVLTIDAVDALIEHLYLTSYDLPPIDHIRKLVSENKEIRDAIVAIHSGNPSSVSDVIKNKLYLAGIVGLNKASRAPVLKNRILEHALSQRWLAQLQRDSTRLDILADEEYTKRNYSEALRLYTEFVEQPLEEQVRGLAYYKMGLCAYDLKQYDRAIGYLTKFPIRKAVYPVPYYASLITIGWCQCFAGKYRESVATFRSVVEEVNVEDYATSYYRARLGLARALMELGDAGKEEAEDLYRQIVSNAAEVKAVFNGDESWNRTLTSCRLNLSAILSEKGKNKEAQDCLKDGLSNANPNQQVLLLIALGSLEESQERRLATLREASELIIGNGLPLNPFHVDDGFEITHKSLVSLVSQLHAVKAGEAVSRLVRYAAMQLGQMGQGAEEVANAFVGDLYAVRMFQAAEEYIETVLNEDVISLTEEDKRLLMAIGLVASSHVGNKGFEKRYAETVLNGSFQLSSFDYGAIFYIAQEALERGDSDLATRLAEACAMRSSSDSAIDSSAGARYVTRYLDIVTRLLSTPNKETLDLAIELADELKFHPKIELPFVAADAAGFMRRIILNGLRQVSLAPRLPAKRPFQKLGRNERVRVRFKDGSVQEGKYKNFQQAVVNGDCILIPI